MPEPVLAWHWLNEDRRLAYKPRRLVKPGQTITVKPPLKLCSRGLHASVRAIDALEFATGPIICRVECSGEILHGDDKLCCQHRKVLWMADATTTLHRFACDVAEEAMKTAKIEDERLWKAIHTKRLWLEGKATNEELAAASAAASAAAWAAASAAAWDAAWAAASAAASAAQNARLESMLSQLQPEDVHAQ